MIAALLIPIALATVINGNTSSSTRVTTSVSGDDASVNVKVTTTVNGKTETVTSDKPGTIEVIRDDNSSQVKTNGNPITPTTTIAPDLDKDSTQSASSSMQKDTVIGDTKLSFSRYYMYGLVERLVTSIRNFFDSLLDKP